MLNAVLRLHWSIFGKNESCGQSCGSFTEVYILWMNGQNILLIGQWFKIYDIVK